MHSNSLHSVIFPSMKGILRFCSSTQHSAWPQKVPVVFSERHTPLRVQPFPFTPVTPLSHGQGSQSQIHNSGSLSQITENCWNAREIVDINLSGQIPETCYSNGLIWKVLLLLPLPPPPNIESQEPNFDVTNHCCPQIGHLCCHH